MKEIREFMDDLKDSGSIKDFEVVAEPDGKLYVLVGVNEDISDGYIQRLIDEAEAEFLHGKQSDIVPVGMLQGMFTLRDAVKLPPAWFGIDGISHRRGKGERKRNKRERWR